MKEETKETENLYVFSSAVRYSYHGFNKMSDEMIAGESFCAVDFADYNNKFDYGKFDSSHVFSCGIKVKSISEFMEKAKQYKDDNGNVVVIFNLRVV